MYQDLEIPMKIEIQRDSSTANSLTGRLGPGQRKKHIEKTAQMLEPGPSLWYSADHGSTLPLQDEGDEPMMDLVTGLQTRCEYRDLERDPGRSTSTETDSCEC